MIQIKLRIEAKYPTFFHYVRLDVYMYVCMYVTVFDCMYIEDACSFSFCALNFKLKAGI